MTIEEIKKILPKDYCKQASRDLTVFTSSIFGETYVSSFKELFGIEFSSILWVVRKGNFMTFYRSENDHQNFRKLIGEKLRNKKFAFLVVSKLKEFTVWFNEFLLNNNSKKDFLQSKEEFVNNYREFFAYHQAVYWGGDYLLEHYSELNEIIKSLQDAYAYNERVVPNVETYLCNLKIDHLTYKQNEGEFKETGLFFFNNQETIKFYGADLEEIESFIIGLSKVKIDLKELKGICVSLGKVIGRVQIIKDPNKLNEAKKENIIVTGMTRPQFNSILAKCKGIITNEGNILSHAAILAREFNIPCVVGTKIALEVFQEGDVVELDATNGVVRLVKREQKPF